MHIGELWRELEKVQTLGGGRVGIPTSGKPKAAALRDAGISTSTAQRYEQLVGGNVGNGSRSGIKVYAQTLIFWCVPSVNVASVTTYSRPPPLQLRQLRSDVLNLPVKLPPENRLNRTPPP